MLYASLTGPLLGLYYPVPTYNEREARIMLNTSKLKSLWCELYSAEEACHLIAIHGGMLCPPEMASRLDYDHHAVATDRAPDGPTLADPAQR